MARFSIRCEDSAHQNRRALPGWSPEPGFVDLPDGVVPTHQLKGYLCDACGRERRAQASRATPRTNANVTIASVLADLLAGRGVSDEKRAQILELASRAAPTRAQPGQSS